MMYTMNNTCFKDVKYLTLVVIILFWIVFYICKIDKEKLHSNYDKQ